jgi:hypothetical protein
MGRIGKKTSGGNDKGDLNIAHRPPPGRPFFPPILLPLNENNLFASGKKTYITICEAGMLQSL